MQLLLFQTRQKNITIKQDNNLKLNSADNIY